MSSCTLKNLLVFLCLLCAQERPWASALSSAVQRSLQDLLPSSHSHSHCRGELCSLSSPKRDRDDPFRAFSAFDPDMHALYRERGRERPTQTCTQTVPSPVTVIAQKSADSMQNRLFRPLFSHTHTHTNTHTHTPTHTPHNTPTHVKRAFHWPWLSPTHAHNTTATDAHAQRPMKKKKILVLMSDTGGGHRASAQALDEALSTHTQHTHSTQYTHSYDVEILDIWTQHACWPFNTFVPAYRFVAKYPWLWRAFFAYGTCPVTRYVQERIATACCYNSFKRAINASNPDMVVSVHPLCQHIPVPIVREMNRERARAALPLIPFVTIVTDLASAHVSWFDKRVDRCFVPSQEIAQLARRCGVREEAIRLCGLPVRSVFWKMHGENDSNTTTNNNNNNSNSYGFKCMDTSNNNRNINDNSMHDNNSYKMDLRKKLGLLSPFLSHTGGALTEAEREKVVLMMGGGDGVGKLDRIAAQLARSLNTLSQHAHTQHAQQPSHSQPLSQPPSQSQSHTHLVVICGHNRKTRERLQRALPSTDTLSVHVRGFQRNIHEYMAASDCLISKAGPGTIAEAMICGLPIVLSSFLPGQESGNLDYCVKRGFGIYTGSNPTKIANAVTELLRDEERLGEMSRRAREESRPEATLSIARELGEMLVDKPPVHPSPAS